MYVISLVRLRKNLWVFLRIIVVLIVIGLVLPRVIATIGEHVSPGVGWLKAAASTVASWFGRAVSAVGGLLHPFVETLKQYYEGR